MVDLNGRLLTELQDRLDIRTVQGHASHPRVLEKAGAADADILVALTDSDETNMVACQIAYSLYRTPVRIARIRAAEYTSRQELFGSKAIPVDTIISPEQLVTEHIEQLIHYPGAHQVLDFADGKVRLVGLKAKGGGPLIGQELRELRRHIPHTDARVAAIYRQSSIPPIGNEEPIYETILPEGDTVIRENDLVFFLAARKDIRVMMSELLKLEHPARSIIIAGGGHIGFELARRLENTNRVKVIERDYDRARYISERLKHAVVLTGDAVDEKLLQEENIDKVDVFCALTSAEEANILSSFLAKRMGASRVIALINRPSYAKLVENQYVDIAVSPQEITLSALLAQGARHAPRRRPGARAAQRHRGGHRGGRARRRQNLARGGPARRRSAAAAGRHHRRHRARQRRADGPPRHGDPARRPRHPFPHRPQPDTRRGEAVPGERDLHLKRRIFS